jgi:hypothetical protein
MSTTVPNEAASARPWENPPVAQQHVPQPGAYPPPAPGAYPQQPPVGRSGGSVLRHWPTWAQNTALAVGAVAVLVVVFFAGFFAGHASADHQGGFGTGQNLDPRQYGGYGDGFSRPGAGS